MLFWIFLSFCPIVHVDPVSGTTSPPSPCSSDIIPCYGASSRGPRRRSTTTASTPVWGEVAGDHGRRRPARRRVARRKVHRHSTRVLNFKPAVILLPPFDTVQRSTTNRLDPFIINVSNLTTTPATTPGFDILQALPLEDHQTTTPRFPPPRTFLLPPPAPDQSENFIEAVVQLENPVARELGYNGSPTTPGNSYGSTTASDYYARQSYRSPTASEQYTEQSYRSPTASEQYTHQSYRSPTTPDQFTHQSYRSPTTSNQFAHQSYRSPTTARYSQDRDQSYKTPVTNVTGGENPFVKLEKEYNDIQKIVEYDLTKESSTNGSLEEGPSSSQYRTHEDYNSPTVPTYNATTVQYAERWNDSFFEERSLKNDYSKSKTGFSLSNNSLLAPEVASLGMKILTSRQGMKMLKELADNDTAYGEPAFSAGNAQLETAETGDFRLQAYDNQILTFEDSNDVTKEALKALKKTHKPFQICNGRQGYVPDSASGCQIFYICLGRGSGEPMVCPNGTLFNQDFLVCDWWYNVECSNG